MRFYEENFELRVIVNAMQSYAIKCHRLEKLATIILWNVCAIRFVRSVKWSKSDWTELLEIVLFNNI